MKTYSCDFETTTEPFYNKYGFTRVWVWGAVDLDSDEFIHDNDISSFIKFLSDKPESKCYFHNLGFDSDFIIYHLLTEGYERTPNKKEKSFDTIIDRNGVIYEMSIVFENGNKCEIFDSYKKIPLKVEKIPKAFGLPEMKGEIDYDLERPEGYIPTQEELAYLYHDCHIVSEALKAQFKQGLTKMTIGSDALEFYTNMIGGPKSFEGLFPTLTYEADNFIRESYKGGFVYTSPRFRNITFKGISYDVNSLYPSVYSGNNGPLPYGLPVWFEGEYQYDEQYPLYIVKLMADFDIKPNHIPTIQIKHYSRFLDTEYIEHSKGPVELTLTKPDLELFLEHYDINFINYLGGYKFAGSTKLFTAYANYWGDVKIKASVEGNEGMRTIAKLLLNNLYGKLCLSTIRINKQPEIDSDKDCVKYVIQEPEYIDSVYTACGSFITAYARCQTIRSAQLNYDRFVYADTDSIHLMGTEEPTNIPIDDNKLGYWKCEGEFEGKFLRAKTYIKIKDGKVKITCAGMPDNIKNLVASLPYEEAFENFDYGKSYDGKLIPKRVKGGIVLFKTQFTIKGVK